MEMNFDNELLFTGGRDGTIFRSTLSDAEQLSPSGGEPDAQQIYEKIYNFDNKKQMITALKYDPLHEKLWVGTPSSTFYCLDLRASGASEFLSVQGLPWMTDY